MLNFIFPSKALTNQMISFIQEGRLTLCLLQQWGECLNHRGPRVHMATCCHPPGLPVLAELGERHLYLSSHLESVGGDPQWLCRTCLHLPPQAMQCIFNLSDLKFTNVNMDKRGRLVSWMQWNLWKAQPNSSICHISSSLEIFMLFSLLGAWKCGYWDIWKGFAAFWLYFIWFRLWKHHFTGLFL